MTKKLQKSIKNKILFGVCGGIAEYFKIDPTIVRLIFLILAFFNGAGLVLYIISALIMPNPDPYQNDEDIESMKSANMDDEKSEKEGNSKKAPHSDEEFSKFFKK